MKHELSKPGSMRSTTEVLLTAIVLVCLTWIVHSHALSGFWRADDGAHLKYAVDHSPWAYFFDPAVTRGQSGASVTPWNVFFYDLNLALFGFSPRYHYAHLLLLVAASAFVFQRVLRIWLPLEQSLIGATLFLLGKPTLYIGQYLMVGHYATGLLLSLLAIVAWHRALTTGRTWSLAAGTLLYLLATTCKEVYVPLPLLLFALPIGTWRHRARQLWPFLVVAACYAGWRHAVLGQFVGGYNPAGSGLALTEIARQFSSIPYLLAAPGTIGIVEMILVVALTAHAAVRRRLSGSLMLAATIVAMVPLIPLTTFPGIHSPDRYLYVVWTLLAVLVATALPREGKRGLTIILGAGLILAAALGVRSEKTAQAPELARNDALYHFILEHDPARQALFVPGDDGYWSLVLPAARHARSQFDRIPQFGERLTVVSDTAVSVSMLSSDDLVGKVFYRYVDGAMARYEIDELQRKAQRQIAAGVGKPLSVVIRYRQGAIHWNFGPHAGRYLVWVDGLTTTRVPAAASYPWQSDRLLRLRVCYESADDWVGCSPTLTMHPPDTREIDWRGPIGATAESQPDLTRNPSDQPGQ